MSFLQVTGQNALTEKADRLKTITDMPYICTDTVNSYGCGQSVFWDAVTEKEAIIPCLLEKLDDTTKTAATVQFYGGKWTVADIAYTALQEIIKGIPTYELLGVPFNETGCGHCVYWIYLRKDINRRKAFKEQVTQWYARNKKELIWVESDQTLTCDCRFSHPNGGYYELRK
jgi:hypothetical protein